MGWDAEEQLFAEPRMPIWEYGDDLRPKLKRPSLYWREAQRAVSRASSRGEIGYKVKNLWGDVKNMTFLQYERLKDLFERGQLEIVDKWYAPHYDQMMGLGGVDTEGLNAGVDRL